MTAPLTLDDKISWSSSQLATEVEGEVVLLSIEQGSYYGLDGIGSLIWRKLQEPVAVGALCEGLAQEFNGDEQVISRDVLTFLDGLLGQGLIERAG